MHWLCAICMLVFVNISGCTAPISNTMYLSMICRSCAIERSRKRHKTDDRVTLAKRRALPALPLATTPLSSASSSTVLDPLDSEDEDNFDLPVIKLPGTPTTETEMETEEGGATGVSITPETVTQRTKAKKDTDTTVGVASDKQGGASKRRSDRQSAGAGGKERPKSSRESGEGAKARKGKTTESEAVSKKTCKFIQSSHGTKELFNLPPLVLKARHLSGSAFCMSI